MAGPIESQLLKKIETAFEPQFVEIQNESHMHSVPRDSETHFRLIVVSTHFSGLTRIARQRLVNEAVKELMVPGKIHALTQKTFTPEEWSLSDGGKTFVSPRCHGGD